VSGTHPTRRNLLQRLAANHGLKLASLVIGILAGIVAIVAGAWEVADRMNHDTASGKPSAGAASPATIPTATSSRSPSGSQITPSTVGVKNGCISSDNRPVDCDESHRYEAFPGECAIDAMLDYMGGRAGLDVAFGHPIALGAGRCLLDSGREVSKSARDVLATDDGDDAWRRCYDSRRNRIIPCDEPHSGEYVATGGKSKASQDECIAAAGAYMDRSVAANSELLRVQVINKTDDDQNSPRCLISIRGTQRLSASVRRIGVNTLPLVT
jgi:hypothetical protein